MTSIVEASIAHVDVIAALHAACFDGPGEHWDAASVADILTMPGAFGHVFSEDKEPAGFMLARIAADEAEIISIGVATAFRRRGIASCLLAAAVKRLKPLGCTHLLLEVGVDNVGAGSFYQSHGFVECGRRTGYYRRADGSVDALILRLDF